MYEAILSSFVILIKRL